MTRFRITESDRNEILELHKKYKINEASTGVAVPATNAEMVGGKTVTNTPAVPATQVQNYTITQLQDLLNQRGYNVGKADGFFGKNTLAQIQAALAATKTSQGALAQQQAAQGTITQTGAQNQSPVAGLPVPEPQKSNEPEIKIPKPYVSGQVTDKTGTIPDLFKK
jgi:hypothetical protein